MKRVKGAAPREARHHVGSTEAVLIGKNTFKRNRKKGEGQEAIGASTIELETGGCS